MKIRSSATTTLHSFPLQISVILLVHAGLLIAPTQTKASQVLSENIVAEVKSDVAVLKAGPGTAYIDRGRVYKGDSVQILTEGNLFDWVRVRAGKLEGYLRIYELKFQSNEVADEASPNLLRRQKDYQYDQDGKRLDLNGKRIGSGETELSPRQKMANRSYEAIKPLRLSAALGVGQLKRSFQSNSELRSLLSKTEAGPIVFCSQAAVQYRVNEYLQASIFFMDYRLGKTTLQTAVLNEGDPFYIDNNGQMVDGTMGTIWETEGWTLGGGVFFGFHRHTFQETLPMPVFLSSNTSIFGGSVYASMRFERASVMVSTQYGRVLDSNQTPVKSGRFNNGRQTTFTAKLNVPIHARLDVYIHANLYSLTTTYSGSSEHLDILTDPAQPLTYTAAQEINALSSVLLGATWHL